MCKGLFCHKTPLVADVEFIHLRQRHLQAVVGWKTSAAVPQGLNLVERGFMTFERLVLYFVQPIFFGEGF